MTSINLGLRDGFLSILIKKFWFFSSFSWKFNECLKRRGIAAAAFAAKSITWRQVHYHRCIIKAFTLTSYRIYFFFLSIFAPLFQRWEEPPFTKRPFRVRSRYLPSHFFFLFEMVESIREQREARKIWSRAARTNLGENHHNRWLNS